MNPIAMSRTKTDGEKALNLSVVLCGLCEILMAIPVQALFFRTRSAPMRAVL